MNGFLLDTNLPSELFKPQPDRHVLDWLESYPKSSLFLSVVTLGELRKGATLLPSSAKRSRIEHAISTLVPFWFSGRILPVTQAVAERWGVFEGERQRAGRPLGVADGMIAATAFEYGFTFVTRNTKDFVNLDLNLFNPWAIAP